MTSFNPFGKTLHDLIADDLDCLRSTPEGWYVEYKRTFPSALSAAKSLSAFANSYGGWIFYGIAESSDNKRTAGSFLGVPASEIPQIEEWLQAAASRHLSSSPYFEHRIFIGPCQALGLEVGRAIVVVHVLQGRNTPHVHSSGRIYRRVADASDPVHETDRHFLDLLFQRQKESRKNFARFLKSKPPLSPADRTTTYARLLFFPDPWGERALSSILDFERFSTLMSDSSLESGGLPFDNVFTSADGLVARQVVDNDRSLRLFTWQHKNNCIDEITLPLNSVYLNSADDTIPFLYGYDLCERFATVCEKQHLRSVWVLDLCQFLTILIGVMVRLQKLYEAENLKWPVFFKAVLTGCSHRCPFFDVKPFVDFVEQFGIPLVEDEDIVVPAGKEPGTCIELEDRGPELSQTCGAEWPLVSANLDAVIIFAQVARAFGIPSFGFGFPKLGKDDPENRDYYTQLLAMGDRTRQVLRNRMRIERSRTT